MLEVRAPHWWQSTCLTALVASVALIAACGGGGASAPASAPTVTLQSIAVTPNPVPTGVGIDRQLTATGTRSDGSTVDLTTNVEWATADASIGAVTAVSGIVSGTGLGSTTITATYGSIVGKTQLNVTSNTWASAGATTLGDAGGQAAVLLANGQVLLTGGGGGTTVYAYCSLYDPTANAFTRTAAMMNPRFDQTATLLNNGKALIAGGDQPFNGSITSVELFDPASATWSQAASLLTARGGHTATLLPNGTVLAAGGATPDGTNAGAEVYDPVANAWSVAGTFTPFRAGHTATLLPDGMVLVVGGTGNLAVDAQLYDPATMSWSIAASPTVAREFHAAVLLPSGKVLIIGGVRAGVVPSETTTSVEIYDPVTNTWSAAADLPSVVQVAGAALLPNGLVLVVGNSNPNDVAPGSNVANLLYDPVANSWSAAASGVAGAAGSTVTLLKNGAVLVAGDWGDAEIYW